MAPTPTQRLGQLILDMQNASKELEEVVRDVLHQPDQRLVIEDLQDILGGNSLIVVSQQIVDRYTTVESTLRQFREALYYIELEKTHGKGDWRVIADADADKRVSVNAIISIRKSHGLGLYEAKKIVEAYQAGFFK